MRHIKLLLVVLVLVLAGCMEEFPLYTGTVDDAQIISTSANPDVSMPRFDYTLTFVPYTPAELELPFSLSDIMGMQGIITSRASQNARILGRDAIYYTVYTNEKDNIGKYHVFVDGGTKKIFFALSGDAKLCDTDEDGDCEVMVYTTGEKQLNERAYMTSVWILDKTENGYVHADLLAAISDYLRRIHLSDAEFSLYCQAVSQFDYLLVTEGTEEDYREYSCLAEFSGEGYRVTDTRTDRIALHPGFVSNTKKWWVETEKTFYLNEVGVSNPLYIITVCGPDGERYAFNDSEYNFSGYGDIYLTRSLTVHPTLPYAALCVPNRIYTSDEIFTSSVYIIDLTNGEIIYTLNGGEILWSWREEGKISRYPTDYCDAFSRAFVYLTTQVIPGDNVFSFSFELIDDSQICVAEETLTISFVG